MGEFQYRDGESHANFEIPITYSYGDVENTTECMRMEFKEEK